MQSDYLAPGQFVDSDSEPVREFARQAVGEVSEPRQQAIRLFEAVRDRVWYDPFTVSTDPQVHSASARRDAVLQSVVPPSGSLRMDAHAPSSRPGGVGSFVAVRLPTERSELRE